MTNEELKTWCVELQDRVAALEMGREYEEGQREKQARRNDAQLRDLDRQLEDARHDGWRKDDKIRDLEQRVEQGRRY